jgi:hypothetical protein
MSRTKKPIIGRTAGCRLINGVVDCRGDDLKPTPLGFTWGAVRSGRMQVPSCPAAATIEDEHRSNRFCRVCRNTTGRRRFAPPPRSAGAELAMQPRSAGAELAMQPRSAGAELAMQPRSAGADGMSIQRQIMARSGAIVTRVGLASQLTQYPFPSATQVSCAVSGKWQHSSDPHNGTIWKVQL